MELSWDFNKKQRQSDPTLKWDLSWLGFEQRADTEMETEQDPVTHT